MQKGQTLIFVLVGILVIVGIAGGAYYLGRQATPKPQPTSVVSQTTQPSPTPDETVYTEATRSANWKVLESDKFGFQFKYPPEWDTLFSDFSNLPKEQNPTDQLASAYVCIDVNFCVFHIDIFLHSSRRINEINKDFEGNTLFNLSSETPVQVFGLSGTKLIWESKDGRYAPVTYYVLSKAGEVFVFQMRSQSNKGLEYNLRILKTVDQIFNTFKFLK